MIRTDAVHSPPRTLTGFLADSDRPGFRRLYLTADRNYHAEFRAEDVVETALVPATEAPFVGYDVVRVTLEGDDPEYNREAAEPQEDEFDLDLESGPKPSEGEHIPKLTDSCEHGCITDDLTCEPCDTGNDPTCPETCGGPTCVDTCQEGCTQTCHDCPTDAGETCDGGVTCGCQPPPPTAAGNTCEGGATCEGGQTCEGGATCGENTCADTCRTCMTECEQPACDPPPETLEGHTCIEATVCNPDLCLVDP
jgi:hypothetical protein